MSIWDDPELKINSDYIKFENPGDNATGTIVAIRAHKFDDGNVVPQIILNTADGEKTVTAGQMQLKALLAEKRPNVGDNITITFTEIEKRSGGKTLKKFDVQVGAAAVTAAPAATAGDSGAGAYTPEQIEAMKLLGMEIK
jgi:uncharacterized protein YhfF